MRSLRVDDSPSADDASTTTTVPLLVTPAAAAATGGALLQPAGGGGGGSDAGTTVYPDSNMVIILAALLCVLICALGLNSLVRCARHCLVATGTDAGAGALVVAAPPAAVASGLNKRELRKIPVVEYETSGAGVGDVPAAGTECAICLGEFADGDKVRLLPRCHHGFHVRCIDRWLAAHSSCPICRGSLLDEGHHGAMAATVDAGEAT